MGLEGLHGGIELADLAGEPGVLDELGAEDEEDEAVVQDGLQGFAVGEGGRGGGGWKRVLGGLEGVGLAETGGGEDVQGERAVAIGG